MILTEPSLCVSTVHSAPSAGRVADTLKLLKVPVMYT